MSKYTQSNITNTYISLRCKRQHVSALSSHHQANLICISLVHKVYVHVMGSHTHTLYVLSLCKSNWPDDGSIMGRNISPLTP
jgi:hypothetical protein